MKILKKIGKVLLVILAIISVALVIGLNIKTVMASHKIKDVVDAAVPVEGIEIPDNVQIVGLGEASHGSKEFQELKLDISQPLLPEEFASHVCVYFSASITNTYQ